MISGNTAIVASSGGHLIEIELIVRHLEFEKLVLITTNQTFIDTTFFENVAILPDTNRFSFFKNIVLFFRLQKLLSTSPPAQIISSGAAIGTLAIIIGKIFYKSKCIWIESVANTTKFSISGNLARHFCDKVYVQSSELKNEKKNVFYFGSLI